MILTVPTENLEMELDYRQLLTWPTYPITLNSVSFLLWKHSQYRGAVGLTHADAASETGAQGCQPAAEADQRWC